MIDEKGIRERLRELYGGPGWTVYEELERGGAVRTPGGVPSRTIDFFAIHRAANKLRFVAIEIKTDPCDLGLELRTPAKRKVWEGVVDECLFACPHDLVLPHHIPDPWGLITFKGNLVVHAKPAMWCKGVPDQELCMQLGLRGEKFGRNMHGGSFQFRVDVDGGVAKAFTAYCRDNGTSRPRATTEALAEYLDRRNIPYHRSIPLDLSA